MLATPALADSARAPVAPAKPAPRAPAVNLAPIDVSTLPDACRPIAKQASAPVVTQALQARVNLAGCIAEQKVGKLELLDTQESMLAIEDAIQPSLALLDEVAKAGDLPMQVIALHARGELYTSMANRMLAAIPPAPQTPDGAAFRETRKALLENLLAPWRGEAIAAAERVVELAKQHPELTKNPMLRTALRASQDRVATKVATAAPAPADDANAEPASDDKAPASDRAASK
ncbi:MAG TPA: hypothetical protein VFQ53_11330 [Kofleriaceae bacterium]|nr:hypothetical protein [Kofleriaceae bacterium]